MRDAPRCQECQESQEWELGEPGGQETLQQETTGELGAKGGRDGDARCSSMLGLMRELWKHARRPGAQGRV